jgi:SPP1 family predicted phage head-tail adaptor
MAIQAGRLRHRIDVQSSTEAADIYGEDDPTWVTDNVVWASVEPITGKELDDAKNIIANVTHKVFIRYKAAKNLMSQQRFLGPKQVTSLGAAISTTDGTSITVSSATEISDTGDFIIRIGSEDMIVTAGQGTTTWTVTRGAFGTTAATHADESVITKLVILNIKAIMNKDERNEFMRIDCTESTSEQS